MTTAHRPTFDPARGSSNANAPTRFYSARSLPAHRMLKYRQPGQGTESEAKEAEAEMRETLLAAEAEAYIKNRPAKRSASDAATDAADETGAPQRLIEDGADVNDETPEQKRQRIWQETKDMDAADSADEDEGTAARSDSDDSSDEEDETAELMRELAKIKAERAAEKAKLEAEAAEADQAQREEAIAFGNPLLNPEAGDDFVVKRRWDEDVVFRVKEKDERGKKDFINDMLRSDFHRSFMKKYVR